MADGERKPLRELLFFRFFPIDNHCIERALLFRQGIILAVQFYRERSCFRQLQPRGFGNRIIICKLHMRLPFVSKEVKLRVLKSVPQGVRDEKSTAAADIHLQSNAGPAFLRMFFEPRIADTDHWPMRRKGIPGIHSLPERNFRAEQADRKLRCPRYTRIPENHYVQRLTETIFDGLPGTKLQV